jgi:hypothetical protein
MRNGAQVVVHEWQESHENPSQITQIALNQCEQGEQGELHRVPYFDSVPLFLDFTLLLDISLFALQNKNKEYSYSKEKKNTVFLVCCASFFISNSPVDRVATHWLSWAACLDNSARDVVNSCVN